MNGLRENSCFFVTTLAYLIHLSLKFKVLNIGYMDRYADKQKHWKLLKEQRDILVERFVLSTNYFTPVKGEKSQQALVSTGPWQSLDAMVNVPITGIWGIESPVGVGELCPLKLNAFYILPKWWQNMTSTAAKSPTKFCSVIKTGSIHCDIDMERNCECRPMPLCPHHILQTTFTILILISNTNFGWVSLTLGVKSAI